ncbi:MAG: hypothetical protein ACFFBD_20555, partial [Candidatus Hodarchaeota archaeon]
MSLRVLTHDELAYERINSLQTDELVKDILRGWLLIRRKYAKDIRHFRFTNRTKIGLRRLAHELYSHYVGQFPSQVCLDEGILKTYFSVQIYGHTSYPLLAYPYNLLAAESLNPTIFDRVLQQCTTDVAFDGFARLFWREKHNCKAKLSEIDLCLLTEFFRGVTTRSSIGFPSAPEVRGSEMDISESTASIHYSRLLNLDILGQLTNIDYARLSLVPLLKISSQTEPPSEIESLFTTWETPLSSDQSLQFLRIPQKSSFWAEYSANDIIVLQTREVGVNFHLFNGQNWNLSFLEKVVEDLPITESVPVPQWQMKYDLDNPFPFRVSDLKLLTELQATPERRIRHLGSRVGIHPKFVSNRLTELQEAKVFQTYFKLRNVGLNERYCLLVLGNENELIPIYQFICHLPQYYINKAKECLYAIVYLTPESELDFFNACARLGKELDLPLYLLIGNVFIPVFITFW